MGDMTTDEAMAIIDRHGIPCLRVHGTATRITTTASRLAKLEAVVEAAWKAHSLIDEAIGDTEPYDEDDPLLRAAQVLIGPLLAIKPL